MAARWRIVVAVAFLAVVGALIGWQVYLRKRPPESENPGPTRQGRGAPVAVEVAPVARTTLREVLVFSGSLTPRSRIPVAARVGGRLERLLVDVGDLVSREQVVAELEQEEYLQELAQAEAELEVARAIQESSLIGQEAALRELERARILRQEKIASEAELDQADTQRRKADAQLAVARAQVKQKEVSLETVRLRLSQTRVRASWQEGGGPKVVGERFADPGTLLKAGDTVLSILELDPLVAGIQVVEQSYSRIRVGQKAQVTADAFPGRQFAGTVATVAPFLSESTRQAEARVEIRNLEGVLKPGMVVRVAIEISRRENALSVPASALAVRQERSGVFWVDEDAGKVRFIPVKVGIAEGQQVEILEPALSGLVVTLGQHLLEDGASVKLP